MLCIVTGHDDPFGDLVGWHVATGEGHAGEGERGRGGEGERVKG
jgi:hypothetical protein